MSQTFGSGSWGGAGTAAAGGSYPNTYQYLLKFPFWLGSIDQPLQICGAGGGGGGTTSTTAWVGGGGGGAGLGGSG